MGFCTFSSTVHYYNLKSNLSQPQMLVVPDLADPFLPVPDDLLVNLGESRSVVDTLLDSLAQASIVVVCVCGLFFRFIAMMLWTLHQRCPTLRRR